MRTKTKSRHDRKRELAEATTLPNRFTPKFWEEQDGRVALVREIRRRVELLRQHTNADSYQKELLCERAIFLACQLETMEIDATTKGELDMGAWVQGCNALNGILKALGLEKAKLAEITDLKAYLKERKS